jgi:hypothetical protein
MKFLFVFCEGAHDIALLERLLPQLPNVTKSRRSLKDYPAPFHGFWKQKLTHIVAGMDKRPAEHRGKLPPPWFELAFEAPDTIYMLFSMNGKDQRTACATVLREWKELTEAQLGLQYVEKWNAAFILDADDEGVVARRRDLFEWLKKEKLILDAPQDGAWAPSGGYSVGCFVVHGPDSDRGAIEDHWIPIADSAVGDRMRDARGFVQQHQRPESKVLKPGRVGKATLTIAGQIDSPGDSLAVILRDTTWATDQVIASSTIGQELLQFLRSVP